MDTLIRGSLWDMQNHTGTLLKNSSSLLEKYAEDSGQTLDQIISGVKKINTTEFKNISSGIYDKLFK